MPLPLKTLAEISNVIRAELEAGFTTGDAFGAASQGPMTGLARANNLNVTAKVMGGGLYDLQGLIAWAFDQRLPQTATLENLEKLGDLVGLSRAQAAKAAGQVVFTGVPGSLVTAGDRVQGGSSQVFVVDTGGPLDINGLGSFAVTADEAGISHNLPGGAAMTLANAIAGVDPTATVAPDGLTGGTAVETDEDLRARIILRYQTPQLGGAVSDYLSWAYSYPGVTRAWIVPAPFAGVGTVGVLFMMDGVYSDGKPLPGDLSGMEAHLAVRAPASDLVMARAPDLLPVDIEIKGLSPDTGQVRAAIAAQLREFFLNQTAVSTRGQTHILYKSKLIQAIANVADEEGHTLVLPLADLPLASDQLPVLGQITFV